MQKKLKVLERTTELKTPWFKVIKEKVIGPINKQEIEFHTLVRKKAILIIPFENDHLYLIKQYRHSVKKVLLELPAGGIKKPNEDPLHCARRELKEETGFEARIVIKIGKFFMSPGYSSQRAEVYLATHLKKSGKHLDSTEIIESLERVSLSKLNEFIKNGRISSGPTLASLFLFLNYLKHGKRI